MPAYKAPSVRKELCFYGQVQGVGFRYRARYAASLFGLTGWVKNLADGSVLLQAQGPEEAIDKMLLQIEAGHYIHIENFHCRTLPLLDDEYGFHILEDGFDG